MHTPHQRREGTAALATLTADLATGDHKVQSKAYQQILDLAEQGNAEAMYQVARCLRQGLGVATNEDRGDYWLRRACVTNPVSLHALLVLGMQHYLMQRPESNPEQGLEMIERAASAGLPIAVVKLSKLLENGGAMFGPAPLKAYRVLANAFGERTDQSVIDAYEDFVQRHAPITNLLDS